jgi:outer membrane biosynthesis protein TonB
MRETTVKITTATVGLMLLLPMIGCSSGLDSAVQQDIENQLHTQRTRLARCYAHALKRQAGVRGQMTLSFRVTEDGEFQDINVIQNQTQDVRLQRCVVRRTSNLSLSRKPDRPVLVTFPLQFKVASR